MKNNLIGNKRILFISMCVCALMAVEFKSGWWAFSAFGFGILFLFVLSRADAHKLTRRTVFFVTAALVAIPLLLQAGAGIFAFLVAFLILLVGDHLRKQAATKCVSLIAKQGE